MCVQTFNVSVVCTRASLCATFSDKVGYTALMQSVMKGDYSVFRLLLCKGADPNVVENVSIFLRLVFIA